MLGSILIDDLPYFYSNGGLFWIIPLTIPCLHLADVQFLPISGLIGTNMKTRVEKSVCSWWNGPCLFEALDALEIPPRDPKGPFRYKSQVMSVFNF